MILFFGKGQQMVWPPGIWSQIDNLLELKFYEAAGLTAQEFWRYVPEPRQDGGLLIVSERCLNIAKQCQLLGIKNFINLDNHENIIEIPPTFLYWCYDGGAINHVPTTTEALAIIRENRKLVKVGGFIDAPGSAVKGMTPVFLVNKFGGIDLTQYIQINVGQ